MGYSKAYANKPTWVNDNEPAINETRLNELCNAVDTIDDRVIDVDNKTLNEISNVLINNLQNNQGIKWNATTQKWVNGVVGGATEVTYAQWYALFQAGQLDTDLFYVITDLSVTGGLTPISYAEYQLLTTEQKNDGTARFVYDYPMENTYLDDNSTTSLTRGWSASKIAQELSAINTKITAKAIDYEVGEDVTIDTARTRVYRAGNVVTANVVWTQNVSKSYTEIIKITQFVDFVPVLGVIENYDTDEIVGLSTFAYPNILCAYPPLTEGIKYHTSLTFIAW